MKKPDCFPTKKKKKLYSKREQIPERQQTRLFSFMNPLAVEIWLYVLVAYVLVSLTLFVVARFSPYEWYNPHPCIFEDGLLKNQFSLASCFWYAVGTLMQQSDINPKVSSLYTTVATFCALRKEEKKNSSLRT
jgi:hypothetical protein